MNSPGYSDEGAAPRVTNAHDPTVCAPIFKGTPRLFSDGRYQSIRHLDRFADLSKMIDFFITTVFKGKLMHAVLI